MPKEGHSTTKILLSRSFRCITPRPHALHTLLQPSLMAPPELHEVLSPPVTAAIIPHNSVHPRRLAPLEPAPVALSDYPLLPSSRSGCFFGDFDVSTHLFPAAFPRCPSNIWSPPPLNESSDEKKRRIQEVIAVSTALKEAQERGIPVSYDSVQTAHQI